MRPSEGAAAASVPLAALACLQGYDVNMDLGPLNVEFGGMRVKTRIGRLPDGFHLWWRSRGLHAYWSRSAYEPHVAFDRCHDWRECDVDLPEAD